MQLSKLTSKSPFFFFHCRDMPKDYGNSNTKPTYTQILVASSIGLIIAAAMHYRLRKIRDQRIVPRITLSEIGQVLDIERFGHYVARQMGFREIRECPNLCKLASDYIRKAEGCEEEMYAFFASEPDVDSLFIKLVEELERCILSYFAFHWRHASFMLSQVLSAEIEPKKKLKHIVMAATREQRFERVTKNLKVARVFTTLVEEMKAIGLVSLDDSQCTNVMVPMAHKDRSPMLLLMGGGMGAGKSTVLKDILKEPFWAGACGNAVVIEADAFKESDVIYRALSSRGHHDMLQTAELVHQSSTDAASSLLVTALNEGRDVIMDGTLSWVPFVMQTITMARNVHRRRYRMGAGYKVNKDGIVTENYWEQIDEEQEQDGNRKRRPYRIELVGVVCDAYLAVIRGIRRAIMCRRAVRVNSQLKSHKRFADAFKTYCQLVDNARLYSTNALEGPPKLIGWKDKDKNLLVDPDEIKCLDIVGRLNEEADSIFELYKRPHPAYQAGSVWNDIVLSPSRVNIQKELKYSIQRIERLRD
ncbi:P-loop containing nucleoside triphosphate hydrolases superfamily protein [Striga hermonthica]|uniref:P-loop containing nucleoside triphosphate hydrolases superfamily protein n=1 Tax=Striga hermonthica TaxID=68872 RepID=A0A9N7NG00_STRHE|nr:P-loop containing nucleoside triphosphate hydrolases superfamily protein [Striga hermonthica]